MRIALQKFTFYLIIMFALVVVLQRWYPDKRGLASGIAVGSFGAGSVIASFIENALIVTLDPAYAFLIMGLGYFMFSFPSAQLLRFPPTNTKPKSHEDIGGACSKPTVAVEQRTLIAKSGALSAQLSNERSHTSALAQDHEVINNLHTSQFWIIYFIYFFGIMPGLTMVSRLADVTKSAFHETSATSTWVVGVNGIFNVLGRVGISVGSDKFGRVSCSLFSITLQIFCLIGLIVSLHQSIFPLFLISIWLLTAGYGAVGALTPGLLSDIFGVKHIGSLYGVAMTAFAVGGVTAGITFNKIIGHQREIGTPGTHLYDSCLYSMIPIVSVAGLLLIIKQWYLGGSKKLNSSESAVQA
jgi:MFS family permease